MVILHVHVYSGIGLCVCYTCMYMYAHNVHVLEVQNWGCTSNQNTSWYRVICNANKLHIVVNVFLMHGKLDRTTVYAFTMYMYMYMTLNVN